MTTQSQNDFMRDWMGQRDIYLECLLKAESGDVTGSPICSRCDSPAKYRCTECMFQQTYCMTCCRVTHREHPFHRLEVWTGHFFRPATKWQLEVGVELWFGHHGRCCPFYPAEDRDSSEDPAAGFTGGEGDGVVWEEEGNGEEDDDDQSAHYVQISVAEALRAKAFQDWWGNPVTTIVHTNGLHFMQVKYCQCTGHRPAHQQALFLGLYPASQERTQTLFTQAVLRDFWQDKVECKTTAYNYYAKLRRHTSPAFPHLVAVSNSWGGCSIVLGLTVGRIGIGSFSGAHANGCG